jgi:PAS domain S-box-containing protein
MRAPISSVEGDPVRQLAALTRCSPMAILTLDPEGRVRQWSPAAERIFGWTQAEVLGLPDPTLPPEALAALLREISTGTGFADRPVVRNGRDGAGIDLSLFATALRDPSRRFQGVLLMAADARQQRRLEQEHEGLLERERAARLEAEAAEYRARFLSAGSALLDGSLDYVLTLNNLARMAVPALADYCLVDELEDEVVSRVAAAHADPEREMWLDRKTRQPLAGDPKRHPTVRVMATGEPVLVQEAGDDVLRSIAHDKIHLARLKKIELHSFMVVPLSARGKILGVITFAYAESRRRYTPADLEMAAELGRRAGVAVEMARVYQASRRAVQARERLLAIVSHDLRNSLATILLNASALTETRSGASIESPVRDQLQWIARSAEQMNRLISDLLDASAIELGRFSIEPTARPAAALACDALEMFAPLAAEKRIEVTWEGKGELPDVLVDAERIQQVLGNLIANAIKFSAPDGSIRIAAVAEPSGEVCFSVQDTGPGIAEADLQSIFDFYWQAQKGRGRGAGLGLAIARAIVEAHGGRIWAESERGRGSSFFFTVPVALASSSG